MRHPKTYSTGPSSGARGARGELELAPTPSRTGRGLLRPIRISPSPLPGPERDRGMLASSEDAFGGLSIGARGARGTRPNPCPFPHGMGMAQGSLDKPWRRCPVPNGKGRCLRGREAFAREFDRAGIPPRGIAFMSRHRFPTSLLWRPANKLGKYACHPERSLRSEGSRAALLCRVIRPGSLEKIHHGRKDGGREILRSAHDDKRF